MCFATKKILIEQFIGDEIFLSPNKFPQRTFVHNRFLGQTISVRTLFKLQQELLYRGLFVCRLLVGQIQIFFFFFLYFYSVSHHYLSKKCSFQIPDNNLNLPSF